MRLNSLTLLNGIGLGLLLAALGTSLPIKGQTTTAPASTRLATTLPTSQPDNDYVQEFGLERSQPYTDIFFFRFGRYIDTPIVVERRGLSVYINNQRVAKKSDRYPPADLRQPEDPGDPPADKSPWEAKDPNNPQGWFWKKKWHYYCASMTFDDSVRAIIRVFENSKGVSSVVIVEDEKIADCIQLKVTADGQSRILYFGKQSYLDARNGPDVETEKIQALKITRAYYNSLCQELSRGGFWFNFGLADTKVDTVKGAEIVRVFESNLTWEQKVAKLQPIGLKPNGDLDMLYRMKDSYNGSPQLLERIRGLDTQVAQFQIPQTLPVFPRPKAPTPPESTTSLLSGVIPTESPKMDMSKTHAMGNPMLYLGGFGIVLVATGIYLYRRNICRRK